MTKSESIAAPTSAAAVLGTHARKPGADARELSAQKRFAELLRQAKVRPAQNKPLMGSDAGKGRIEAGPKSRENAKGIDPSEAQAAVAVAVAVAVFNPDVQADKPVEGTRDGEAGAAARMGAAPRAAAAEAESALSAAIADLLESAADARAAGDAREVARQTGSGPGNQRGVPPGGGGRAGQGPEIGSITQVEATDASEKSGSQLQGPGANLAPVSLDDLKQVDQTPCGQGGRATDGQTGNGQAGAGQAGDGQTGDGQAGAGQAGAGQAGAGQAGAGRTGDVRTAGGQAGEGRSGDIRTGDGQAGAGLVGDGRVDQTPGGQGDRAGDGRTGAGEAGADPDTAEGVGQAARGDQPADQPVEGAEAPAGATFGAETPEAEVAKADAPSPAAGTSAAGSASDTVRSVRVEDPANPAPLRSAIVEHIEQSAKGGNPTIRLVLNPEHLGEVQVKVTLVNGAVHAALQVENATVSAAVQNQLDTLRAALVDQGIKIDKLEVSVSGGSDRQQPDAWAAGGFGQGTGGQGQDRQAGTWSLPQAYSQRLGHGLGESAGPTDAAAAAADALPAVDRTASLDVRA